MMAEFCRQFGQPLDVTPCCSRKHVNQLVYQGSVNVQLKLLGHHLPYLAACVALRRVELDQCDAAGNDGFVDVIDAVGSQEEQHAIANMMVKLVQK